MAGCVNLLNLREPHILSLADFASHLSKVEFWNLKPEPNTSKAKDTSPKKCPILNNYVRSGPMTKVYKELCSLPLSTAEDYYTIMVSSFSDVDLWTYIRFHHVDPSNILVEMHY